MKNILPTLFAFLFVLHACQKENPPASNSQPDQQTIQNLKCLGFDTENAVVCGEHIHLEGDVLVTREAVDAALNFEENSILELNETADDRQYAVYNSTTQSVGLTNVNNIKYFIHSSVKNIANGGADWESAIKEATKNWTDIEKCRIKFTQVTSHTSANITFAASNATGLTAPTLPVATWAAGDGAIACVPKSGSIGRWIEIYSAVATIPLAQKQKMMRHEIGHALGFRHNNAPNLTNPEGGGTDICSTAIGNPVFINGTVEDDALSVMVKGPSTNVISFYDGTSAQFMYPDDYGTPVISSTNIYTCGPCGTSSRLVKFTTNVPLQGPYRVVVARYNTSGVLQQAYPFENPGTAKTFQITCPTGSWKFKILRSNYGVPLSSWLSAFVTVNVQ